MTRPNLRQSDLQERRPPADAALSDAAPMAPAATDPAATDAAFDYDLATSRNLGWLLAHEQQLLRGKCVGIAGLGGVGGSHLLTLTRLGIGGFHIADLDRFELVNFNRQAGAAVSHLKQPKVDVLARMALDINPQLRITRFGNGVNAANLDSFLDGVDLYLDALDFFAVGVRRMVFAACARRSIPAVTAAPLGMGVALLNFLPGKMTFEEYFRLEGHSEHEQLLRFLVGLSPAMLQIKYLVDPSRVDLARHIAPSTDMACEMCAGVAATNVLKILLKRGPVIAAPRGLHFDAYRNRLVRTWRPWGNRHPLQRLTLAVARRKLGRALTAGAPRPPAPETLPPIQRILELARWAPSGDNTQPWRFEIVDPRHLIVHGRDTRDHCVYDLEGHASQIAVGALLETLAIAATGQGLSASFGSRLDKPATNPTFDVFFDAVHGLPVDPLLPYIEQRVTQRRPMGTTPLTADQIDKLQQSVGHGYRLLLLADPVQRRRMAKLLFRSARIRLTIPEAFEVHRSVIQWHARFSEDRIPDQAVGADWLSLRSMQWAMKSWNRIRLLNRYLGGTLLPRLQLDVLPALRCATHFALLAERPPQSLDDYVTAGRAVQRLWLTATALGLQFQPEMTPLIFCGYARSQVSFTQSPQALREAAAINDDFQQFIGASELERAVFLGRMGIGPRPRSRSLRLPLDRLMMAHSLTESLSVAQGHR